jgi:hypothetical protein
LFSTKATKKQPKAIDKQMRTARRNKASSTVLERQSMPFGILCRSSTVPDAFLLFL